MTPEEAKFLLTPAERAIRDDFFSSDNVVDETAVEHCGRRSEFVFKLGYVPVHCGTVKVRVVTRYHRSGEGALAIHPETLLVDNETGNCAVFYREPLPYGASILVSYRYKIDDKVPEIDFRLTSAPVVGKKRKLKVKFRLEKPKNLPALHGPIDPKLIDTFIKTSNKIFKLTRRRKPSYIEVRNPAFIKAIEKMHGKGEEKFTRAKFDKRKALSKFPKEWRKGIDVQAKEIAKQIDKDIIDELMRDPKWRKVIRGKGRKK